MIAKHEVRAVAPAIGFAGVGMDAIDHDLLPDTEKLDALAGPDWPVRRCVILVRREQQRRDLVERLRCPKHNRALGWFADARKHATELAVAILDQLPHCLRRVGIEDVDVERGTGSISRSSVRSHNHAAAAGPKS